MKRCAHGQHGGACTSICLAIRRYGRNHGKRHSTNRERSHLARIKARAGKAKAASDLARFHAWKDQVAAYWRGERDSCPSPIAVAP